jgi:hypothetical protein
MSNFCPKCGAQIRAGARFCGSCGNDMSQSAAPAAQPPAYSPAPAQPQAYSPPLAQPPVYTPPPAQPVNQPVFPPATPQPPAQPWPSAYPPAQPAAPASPDQLRPGEKSVWERKTVLAQHIQQEVAKGGRVESQNDTTAVMVYGSPVNNVLHLILTLITAGLWLLIWIPVAIFGGEKRKMLVVDELGNVQVQKV